MYIISDNMKFILLKEVTRHENHYFLFHKINILLHTQLHVYKQQDLYIQVFALVWYVPGIVAMCNNETREVLSVKLPVLRIAECTDPDYCL